MRMNASVYPSNELYRSAKNLKSSFEDSPSPSISAGQIRVRSLSPDLPASAAMPRTEKQTTLSIRNHSYNLNPNPSQTSSDDSVDIPSVEAFLRHAQLSHLTEELVTLGIKNQSRLRIVAEWQERDVDELLRGSRINRFEALQLTIAFRSLRRSPVSFDVDDARDVD